MKKLIGLLLVLSLLLSVSACSESTDVITPTFDDLPPKAELTVFVDGQQVKSVYRSEQTYYINYDQLCSVLGGRISTEGRLQPPYSATATIKGRAFTFSNDEPTLNEGEQAHPLVFEPLYDGHDWYMPLTPIMSLMGLYLIEESENSLSYSASEPVVNPTAADVAANVRIPVLMYHALGEEPWSSITELFVRPADMEAQLQYLQNNGYTPITFEDMGNLNNIQKPVMLTFDDGYDDNYTLLFPLLKQYNIKATIFIITELIGTEHYLTEAQIKEMSDSGLVSIQSHTVTHRYLSDLGEAELETEMVSSKARIEQITGKEPFVLCYPTGKFSELSLQKTAEHFSFGLLMNGGMYTTGVHSEYKIPRFYISRATDIYTFADNLN
ncbi:MAG: polysaccharide deacetylase family protein [Clostridia bacterium]|nr:polysaccharide deacetylase family protein [Clostridia bacterium]